MNLFRTEVTGAGAAHKRVLVYAGPSEDQLAFAGALQMTEDEADSFTTLLGPAAPAPHSAWRGMPPAAAMGRARRLWDYLRLGVPVQPADCLLVFGGHDPGVARRAADLYAQGIAPFIVATGGPLAVPDGSTASTEADA